MTLNSVIGYVNDNEGAGDITLHSDNNAGGTGDIVMRIAGVEVARFANNGNFQLGSGVEIEGDRYPAIRSDADDITLADSDHGDIILYTGAGTHDVTLDNARPLGFTVVIVNKGTGDLTIDATTNTQTVNNAALDVTLVSGAWETCTLIKIAANEWLVKGEI